MKLSVSSYSFEKHRKATGCDLIEVCRLAKEIGFDAIEFSGDMDGKDPIKRAKEIRKYCDKIGLSIASYTIGANFLDEKIDEMMAKLHERVDTAEALGAPLMRHDVCWALPEGKSWEDVIPEIAPRIREITQYAKSKGIRTCSENHGYIFQDSVRVEKLIQAVGDDNYRWLVDVGNFLCADESPVEAVYRAAPYAIHCHVKDFLYRRVNEGYIQPEGFFRTRNGNLLRGTIIGHGDVPVADCIRVLRASGYDGAVSIEFEGAEENIPAVQMGYAYMRQVIAATER